MVLGEEVSDVSSNTSPFKSKKLLFESSSSGSGGESLGMIGDTGLLDCKQASGLCVGVLYWLWGTEWFVLGVGFCWCLHKSGKREYYTV
jgi:hypothetical protein